jgi:hypothetical protein
LKTSTTDSDAGASPTSKGKLDAAILNVQSGSWHRMAKPDGSEVFVIYNFTIHAEDVEVLQFSERYSSARHKHSLLMEIGLESEKAFPAKEWWRNMVDDDANVLRRGEELRVYFEHLVKSEKILTHPKARSILGYNYSMLQTHFMQSQHGHWIEHDLKARSAIERSQGTAMPLLPTHPARRLTVSLILRGSKLRVCAWSHRQAMLTLSQRKW